MEDFKKFITNLGFLWGLILAGGALVPVLAVFGGLAPQGQFFSLTDIGVVSGFLTLLALCNLWIFGKSMQLRAAKRTFAIASILSLALLGAYWLQLSRFQQVFLGQEFIAGCEWTEEAAPLLKPGASQCPGETRVLMERDGARPDEIWTESSMKNVERMLFALWASLTLSWTTMVGLFAVMISRHRI
ncbi:MAG: hypothetical protein ACKVOJ_11985 [Sphingomonadaceae bacterium]